MCLFSGDTEGMCTHAQCVKKWGCVVYIPLVCHVCVSPQLFIMLLCMLHVSNLVFVWPKCAILSVIAEENCSKWQIPITHTHLCTYRAHTATENYNSPVYFVLCRRVLSALNSHVFPVDTHKAVYITHRGTIIVHLHHVDQCFLIILKSNAVSRGRTGHLLKEQPFDPNVCTQCFEVSSFKNPEFPPKVSECVLSEKGRVWCCFLPPVYECTGCVNNCSVESADLNRHIYSTK